MYVHITGHPAAGFRNESFDPRRHTWMNPTLSNTK